MSVIHFDKRGHAFEHLVGIDFTTVQGLYGHHIAEDNRTYYYYYTGYSTLDEVRDFAENELGSGYSARQ